MDLFVVSTLSCILDNIAPFLIRFVSIFEKSTLFYKYFFKSIEILSTETIINFQRIIFYLQVL